MYANKFFAIGSEIMAVFDGSIGQGGGIWRSGNFGNTWLIGNSGMGSNVVVHHLTQVGGTLWASTSTGLYTSTDNAKGGHRLSPRFVEFLMGVPEGWVCDVPGITRNQALKALGNGIVPQQCAAAFRAYLTDTTREAVA